jgi:hypothetical protein
MSDYISVNKLVWIEANKDAHFAQRDIISEKFLEQTVAVINPTRHVTSEDTRFEQKHAKFFIMNLACRLSCFLPKYPRHAQQILW